MMQETENLLALIGDIYDASLDAKLWIPVVEKVRDFVGGCSASIYSKNTTKNEGNLYYHDGGISPHFTQLYFKTYVTLDPLTMGQITAEIGQPVATADLIPYDEFMESRFYKEWVSPQGLVDFLSVLLDKSSTTAASFGVFRHACDGLVDDGARERLRTIAPHLRRAVLIGNVIDLKAAEVATFNDTLDGLSAAVILVDEAGRIVHANASGEAMIAAGPVLRASNGRLVASEPKSDQALREVFIAAGSGDAGIGIEGIAVSLTASSEAPHVAHVLPLTSGMRRSTGIAYAAVAAVFVQEATLNVPSMQEVIAKHYKLTPTELRVLLAIAEIGSGPEVATALGVTSHTVKSHLHRLYEKTGASRQIDLVKLVARFSSPFNRPNGATT
jgi:DNA-binding CsgD family transcriptional regulator